MTPIMTRTPVRIALASGFATGAWLVLSAFTLNVESYLPADAASGLLVERIHLAQADVAPVERPVSYSSEQADRGEEKFNKECVECHGDDLKGGMNGGAPLRGLSFEEKYADGAPASGLYLYMSILMPPDQPGRFSPDTYLNLMAYILKRNGFQPGAPLPSDVDELDYLILEK